MTGLTRPSLPHKDQSPEMQQLELDRFNLHCYICNGTIMDVDFSKVMELSRELDRRLTELMKKENV